MVVCLKCGANEMHSMGCTKEEQDAYAKALAASPEFQEMEAAFKREFIENSHFMMIVGSEWLKSEQGRMTSRPAKPLNINRIR